MNAYTRKIYFKQEEVVDTGPSVNSEDQEQRIAARRIRIQNRLDQKKAEHDDTITGTPKKELGIGENQIDKSSQKIANVIREGDDFVTNIRVACDTREYLRRAEEDELNQKRIEKLEEDAKLGMEIFDDLTQKWEELRKLEVPQEIRDLLNAQKSECSQIIEMKNSLINEINLELKAKDDHYVREMRKRAEDIDLLAERMETQVQSMQKLYREELMAIENALVAQKDQLFAEQNNEWESLMSEIRKKQENFLEERRIRFDEYDKELNELRARHSEEYNELKHTLESEVEMLESQLIQLKTTFQLNLEKLEYNFQVLKRRDEENMITKSNQKRKITRLLDTLNNLHVNAGKREKQYGFDNDQLSEDYKKRMENFRDLQKKSKQLIETEQRNFRDIWLMNESALKEMAHRLLEANRVINEQQLGIRWIQPDLTFMSNVGPISESIEQLRSKSPAVIALQYMKRNECSLSPHSKCLGRKRVIPTSLREVSPSVVRRFIELICYEPEFLIEEKVKRLLKPLTDEDGLLLRLDTVLTALGITSEEELDFLFTHFVTQKSCNMNSDTIEERKSVQRAESIETSVPGRESSHDSDTQEVHGDDTDVRRSDDGLGLSRTSTDIPDVNNLIEYEEPICESHIAKQHVINTEPGKMETPAPETNPEQSPVKYQPHEQADEPANEEPVDGKVGGSEERDESLSRSGEYPEQGEDQKPYEPAKDKQTEWELISPIGVVNALHQFTLNMQNRDKLKSTCVNKGRTLDDENGIGEPHCSNTEMSFMTNAGIVGDSEENRDDSHDAEYWKKYTDSVVSSETEKVWDNLYVALQRYLAILKHRAKLIRESDAIRSQNIELRHLLKQYLKSPVNQDLQIPPQDTMQIQ